MNRFRFWHWLKLHRLRDVPYDPDKGSLVEATEIRTRCSCGDQWVFYALSFSVKYFPVA